jgi:hypothetical protein
MGSHRHRQDKATRKTSENREHSEPDAATVGASLPARTPLPSGGEHSARVTGQPGLRRLIACWGTRGGDNLCALTATVGVMTAQHADGLDPYGGYEVIHLGGQEAAIVPLADLRRLQALERLAPAEVVEEAEIETTLAAHREWVAAGRPGAVSHAEAMAELLGES